MAAYIQVDKRIPCLFSKVRAGSTFMTVNGYQNNHGEVSNFSIVFHFNYSNAVKKAIKTWQSYKPVYTIEKIAKEQLIESYTRSLASGVQQGEFSDHALKEPYGRVLDQNNNVIDGVKIYLARREIHLTGLLVSKRIIKETKYPKQFKSSLTVAKEKLLDMTSLSRYRQFKLIQGRFNNIIVDNMTFEQEDLVTKIN